MQAMTAQDLKELRESHELTQRAMGELLGYNANYIYRLESGKEKITQRFEKLVRSIIGQKKAKKSS
jgi:transcriptional regulator with XRE-family HTH domain